VLYNVFWTITDLNICNIFEVNPKPTYPMESNKDDFHISFFKPTTESARHNRNMVVQFVIIWAVAIFGFQILLRIVQKPTPEPAYLQFQSEWPEFIKGGRNQDNLKAISQSALMVLGKVNINPVDRSALDNLVSYAAINIADSIQKVELISKLASFEEMAIATENITSPDYVASKNELIPVLQNIFGLSPLDVRGKIAPLEVHSSMMDGISEANISIIENAMKFYLTHNRSFLTDTRFLGFPFHYFYTAFFLLVLFVGLCWLYCIRTDKFNKDYGIED
jgi:putative solute:sodium symporter small subunit